MKPKIVPLYLNILNAGVSIKPVFRKC